MHRINHYRFANYLKIWSLFSVAYLAFSYFLVGFKSDQLVLIFLIGLLLFISKQTRKILIVTVPFIIFWILFDYMKAFPNYNYDEVSIKSLYEMERNLFGFNFNGKIVTPNEYFLINHNKISDLLSGVFYLSWVPVPIFLTLYFLFKKDKEAIYLPVTFLLANLIGFVIYYVYPAAPPWYVAKYGFEFIKSTSGSPAGLIRFDDALGIQLFQSMYQKSSNVFAAMPSLHSAYPVVSLYFAFKKRYLIFSFVIACTCFGIWFFAVYTSHHYVLDVIAGIFCALTGIVLFETFNKKIKWFKKINDGANKILIQ